MNATVKNTAIIASALVIGYVGGGLLGLPPTTEYISKGDITKVSKFHKNSVENSGSAYQQKLLNNATALSEATEATQILSDKLSQFSELVDLSMSVAGEIPELNKEVAALESVYGLSENAMYAGKVASASFEKLQSGNDNELAIDVEQASQNLTLAYLFIDHQVGLGKDFVTAADKYLKKNKNNEDLAMVRDLWAIFCAENAVIDGNDAELAYWGKQELVSSDLVSATTLKLLSKPCVETLAATVHKLQSSHKLQQVNDLQSINHLKTKVDRLTASAGDGAIIVGPIIGSTPGDLKTSTTLNSTDHKLSQRERKP